MSSAGTGISSFHRGRVASHPEFSVLLAVASPGPTEADGMQKRPREAGARAGDAAHLHSNQDETGKNMSSLTL